MNTKQTVFFIIIVAFVVIGVVVFYFSLTGNKANAPGKENISTNTSTNTQEVINNKNTTPTKLQIKVLKEGTGVGAKDGDTVTVNYIGKLVNGKTFDSSFNHGKPFSFKLGVGQVIKGWDEGILGMKVGEKAQLTIPPELAYGQAGTPGGPIPPNATLIFEVDLLKIN